MPTNAMPPMSGSQGLSRPVVVVAILAGIALRVLLLVSPIGRPDADEVIAALMARNIGTDGFPLFFWGQSYGGTPELLPVALSLRLLGDSSIAMRVPTVALAAVISVLLWRVGLRIVSRRAAELAALLAWVAFPPAVWLSVRVMLFYSPTVVLGLVLGLLALRRRDRASTVELVAFWLALGVGVWLSPNIVYFAIPAFVTMGWHERWLARAIRLARSRALAPALVAAAAVIVAIVILQAANPPRNDGDGAGLLLTAQVGSYVEKFVWFFTDGLPGLLGFREMFTYRWILGPVGLAAYAVTLGVIAFGAWKGWQHSTSGPPPVMGATPNRRWDLVGLLAFPLVFSLIPKATDQPNMRYLSFAVPFVGFAVARAATTFAPRRWAAPASLAVGLLVTGLFFQRIYVVSEVERTARVGNVGDLAAAIEVLDDEHIDRAWANYWVTYRVAFESSERIIVAVPWNNVPRYERYDLAVRSATRTAWVVEGGTEHELLMAALRERGVSARERVAGDFVVVIPDRLVRPDELHGPVTDAL